jgi:hypothetical protein
MNAKMLFLFLGLNSCSMIEHIKDKETVHPPVVLAKAQVVDEVSVVMGSGGWLQAQTPIACTARLEDGTVVTYESLPGSDLLPIDMNSRRCVRGCASLKKGDVVDVVQQRAFGKTWTLLMHHKHISGLE